MLENTASDDAQRAPQPETQPETPVRFTDLGLSEKLLQAIESSGYTTPTPIQAKAIPVVLQGRDVLGIAQTGTGKTASFTLPMIDILAAGRTKARMPRTLILEPTRELAAQVAESFDKYGKNHRLTKALLIGGVSFGDQDALLSQGVDVLIATPGRLLDHFERGKLLLSGVQVMVVDEADRMLDMGFIPDIERIFKLTPFTRQTLFFSATMPNEIRRLTEQFLSNPVRIEAAKPATAAETIDQRVVDLPGGDPRTRRAALRACLAADDIKNGIIFCNRKTDVDVVAESLRRHGFNAAPIHGDLDQRTRTATLERFKTGTLQFLIASDVAARGLDIPAVSHIFNYEPPRHADDYIHRIGRTGRAGLTGKSFTLAAPADRKSLEAIEKLTGKPIPKAEIEGVPTAAIGDPRDSGGRGRRAEELREQRRHREGDGRRDKSRFKQRDPSRPTASFDPVERPEGEPAPERAERPEQAARPERSERPERSDRPERGERPPQQARRDERPARSDRPARDNRARGGDRPERGSDRPRSSDRPERPSERSSERPSERSSERSGERRERPERAGAEVTGFGDDLPAFLRTPKPKN